MLILASGESFKSIGPPDYSKWYPSNEELEVTDRSVNYTIKTKTIVFSQISENLIKIDILTKFYHF